MPIDDMVVDAPKRMRVTRSPHSNGGNSRYADSANSPFERDALEHLDALYNFAMYLTRKPSDADDLVQETYLRALRFSHRFEPGTHMRA